MTTLHLTPQDMAAVSSGPAGAWLIDLTKAGEKTVVAVAVQLFPLDQVPPAKRRADWLRQLPDAKLVELATARLGAPDAEVMTEVVRRLQELTQRICPVVGSLRYAGILPTFLGLPPHCRQAPLQTPVSGAALIEERRL
ncbi:hypothetical protein ABT317_14720 [Streptomyces carpinensis]|uniref:Uncharacterized protein n=2 Tax=Streptomyces carpinensis TaxID=66369 RepID=A0ABV1W1Z0_9ACTN